MLITVLLKSANVTKTGNGNTRENTQKTKEEKKIDCQMLDDKREPSHDIIGKQCIKNEASVLPVIEEDKKQFVKAIMRSS